MGYDKVKRQMVHQSEVDSKYKCYQVVGCHIFAELLRLSAFIYKIKFVNDFCVTYVNFFEQVASAITRVLMYYYWITS